MKLQKQLQLSSINDAFLQPIKKKKENSMEEKKKQAVESGSLYMTLDAFYRPVYLSMRGQGEEGFSRYISNNVRSHTTGREFIPDH